jgi:hypothetical protein
MCIQEIKDTVALLHRHEIVSTIDLQSTTSGYLIFIGIPPTLAKLLVPPTSIYHIEQSLLQTQGMLMALQRNYASLLSNKNPACK